MGTYHSYMCVCGQTDATYMRNLDAFLPVLCALAREHGEDKRRMPIRAAALRALSAMVHVLPDQTRKFAYDLTSLCLHIVTQCELLFDPHRRNFLNYQVTHAVIVQIEFFKISTSRTLDRLLSPGVNLLPLLCENSLTKPL